MRGSRESVGGIFLTDKYVDPNSQGDHTLLQENHLVNDVVCFQKDKGESDNWVDCVWESEELQLNNWKQDWVYVASLAMDIYWIAGWSGFFEVKEPRAVE